MNLKEKTEYLFVYGTLRKKVKSSVSSFLKLNSTQVEEALMKGFLYDLGSYPGVVYDAKADRYVKGDVFQLKNPTQIFEVLDEYEGIFPDDPENSLYRRQKVPVLCKNKELLVWVYLYNRPIEGLHCIESGDYIDYISNNTDHQSFIDSV